MTSDHPPTPRLTQHARERCVEMGVSTRRVKNIMRKPDMTWNGNVSGHEPDRTFAWSASDPSIAVYYAMDGETPVAITVVPRTDEQYERLR